jgi:hypothetical protein
VAKLWQRRREHICRTTRGGGGHKSLDVRSWSLSFWNWSCAYMFKSCWPLLDIHSSYLEIVNVASVSSLLHGICPITAQCSPVNSVQHFMQLEWKSVTFPITNRTCWSWPVWWLFWLKIFTIFLSPNAKIVPLLGHSHFLPNPFQFIIICILSYCLMVCSLDYKGMLNNIQGKKPLLGRMQLCAWCLHIVNLNTFETLASYFLSC